MKYDYLVYYIRVDSGNMVGYGNKFIELEHKISKEDIISLIDKLDTEAIVFCDIRVRCSKAMIANIIELN